jgi:hypothetical protein
LQKTFRDVAAQVETMSARVTRSQRTIVAGHKAAASAFVESAQMVQTSIGKIGGAFGIGLGIGAVVEAGKKAVTVFATVDEQARALAVQTRRSEEEIAGFYERVKQVAGAAAIDADKLRDSFDDLARAIGPEAAALPRLAVAAKAMKAPIEDVVHLTEQMNDNLDISADTPAAFDMIQKGTEGTRTTAAGATKGLADLSLQMRGLGEGGEKGLRSTLGLLVAIGKHAPSTEAAVASLQSLMNKVGTRKTDESLEKLGHVPMTAALNEAKRKHQDEFLVFLNEVDKGLTNMAKEAGTPIAAKMQYLQTLIKSPEDRQAIQSILEGMPEYRAIRDREPAQEAGATDKAFRMMKPGATPHNLGVFMTAAEDQLRKEGVPEANVHAAASVLAGNAVQESKLNPRAVHDQGTGYGIYGARLARRDRMLAWLSQHGYAKDSLEGQARYMAHEGKFRRIPKDEARAHGRDGRQSRHRDQHDHD